MKKLFFLFLASAASLFAQTGEDELVNPKELIPDIVIDLQYSRADHKFLNLPGGDIQLPKFYTTNECLLLRKAVNMLKTAQDSLRKIRSFNGKNYPEGIGIKIWDGYRPHTIQYLFWEIYPNATYIADPSGGSKHNRGGAVDLTLVDLSTGKELAMPSQFDDFSEKASLDYNMLMPEIKKNRDFLKTIMTKVGGLNSYSSEWWHYEVPDAELYPICDFQMK